MVKKGFGDIEQCGKEHRGNHETEKHIAQLMTPCLRLAGVMSFSKKQVAANEEEYRHANRRNKQGKRPAAATILLAMPKVDTSHTPCPKDIHPVQLPLCSHFDLDIL